MHETSSAWVAMTALLIFAPLFWGANLPLPLLVLELAAVGLLLYIVRRPRFREHLTPPLQWALLGLLLLPVVQLLPLSFEFWSTLPGRAFYAQALGALDDPSVISSRAVSLVPSATEQALLALLPPIMVFLVGIGLPTRDLQKLVFVFLGIATFQALLGLIQYGDVPDSPFRLGNPYMAGSAFGTYINRNHLAGLLEMALPIGLALLAATVGHSQRRRHNRRRTWRQRLAGLTVPRFNQAAIYGAICIALLLGLIFTRSRSGVALAMLGILLCTVAFSRRLGGTNVYGLMGTFTAVGVGLAALIGLAPILTRFTVDPLVDMRWQIFSGAMRAMGEFFPLGSGNGTFTHLFWRFYPPDMQFDGIIDRAHNDYLEWLIEGGIVMAIVLAVFLVSYLRQWSVVWQGGGWSIFRFVQVGAGISLLLMGLHSFVDFNLHIPANAVFFAFLAAVFFHRHQMEKAEHQRKPHHRKMHHRSTAQAVPSPTRTIPPENAVNPFDEV
ncbi:MAG: O-antigen ligase family protein [Candidatus Competibacteraceae bacterium]|nr:O-antigen ligase family protein [Candidatus Competibacteraceae bacterium]